MPRPSQCRWSALLLFAGMLSGTLAAGQVATAPRPSSPGATTAPKPAAPTAARPAAKKAPKFPRVVKSDRQWRSLLQPNQYLVARRKATEPSFSGIYWDHHEDGAYACVCCGTLLFDAATKFNSGTGWPSYNRVIDRAFIRTRPDFSDGTARTEVICRVCDGHVGHVFNDGPAPTGLRYCINSAAIDFVPRTDIPSYLQQWRINLGLAPPEPEAKPTPDAATASASAKPTDQPPSESPDAAEVPRPPDAQGPVRQPPRSGPLAPNGGEG